MYEIVNILFYLHIMCFSFEAENDDISIHNSEEEISGIETNFIFKDL